MKLCPQCAFIYEDDQRSCEMDGQELVPEQAPVLDERRVASLTRLTIDIPGRSRSGRFPALIFGVLALVTLLSAVYFARFFHQRSMAADQISVRSSERAMAGDNRPQASLPGSLTSAVDTPLAEQSAQPDQLADESLSAPTDVAVSKADSSLRRLSQPPSNSVSLTHARLTSSPVSAGGLTGNNRIPVIVRLTNGATISADEAWERREGVWYRQGGMVTFLKRGRVQTIERPLNVTPKSAAKTVGKSNFVAGQNQLRIRRLEAADTKKESRVRTFLKATGRVFKKPFKF
jgi:hypothetical protein